MVISFKNRHRHLFLASYERYSPHTAGNFFKISITDPILTLENEYEANLKTIVSPITMIVCIILSINI